MSDSESDSGSEGKNSYKGHLGTTLKTLDNMMELTLIFLTVIMVLWLYNRSVLKYLEEEGMMPANSHSNWQKNKVYTYV